MFQRECLLKRRSLNSGPSLHIFMYMREKEERRGEGRKEREREEKIESCDPSCVKASLVKGPIFVQLKKKILRSSFFFFQTRLWIK